MIALTMEEFARKAGEAINEELIREIERAIEEVVRPTIRTMAENTAKTLIGNSMVHMRHSIEKDVYQILVKFPEAGVKS